MNNKTTKSIIISIVSSLLLTLGLSYAYFASSVNGTDSLAMFTTIIKSITQVSFSSSADTTMRIRMEDMNEQSGSNDYTEYKMGMSELLASIQNGSGTPSMTCKYSIVYTPTTSYSPSQNLYNEYTVSGSATVNNATSTVNSFDETPLDNVTNEITLVKNAELTVTGEEETGSVNWNFTFKFYNLAVDQTSSSGKTISGKLSFKNVHCDGMDEVIDSSESVPMSKEPFRNFIKENMPMEIRFVNTGVTEETLDDYSNVDISLNSDGSAYAWIDDDGILYASATEENKYILAPVDSSGLLSPYRKWDSYAGMLQYFAENGGSADDEDALIQEIMWPTATSTIDLQYLDTSQVRDMSGMFAFYMNLSELNLGNFDTSNVTDMSWMFFYTTINQNITFNLNTSSVTDMSYMFGYASVENDGLFDLNISFLDTSNVENMAYMFWGTHSDSAENFSIYISNNTVNVTNMEGMFAEVNGLININNINTSNVTNMAFMFAWGGNSTTIDLSRLNTSNVTNMKGMFLHSPYEELNLTSFETQNVTCMDSMFSFSEDLAVIYVSYAWSIGSVVPASGTLTDFEVNIGSDYTSQNLFDHCISLPNYNEFSVGIWMANTGGYLTLG